MIRTASTPAALAVDPERDDVSGHLADLLLSRALHTEAMGLPRLITDEVILRLRRYDSSGERLAKWDESGHVSVRTEPVGAEIKVQRYQVDEVGHMKLGDPYFVGVAPAEIVEPTGSSLLLTLSAPGHLEVKYPILVARGENLQVSVDLPSNDDAREGFVYVPRGRFVFGGDTGSEDLRRAFYETVPAHSVWTEAYWISVNEVTFAQYLGFLDSLSVDEQALRSPHSGSVGLEGTMSLSRSGGTWVLDWRGERTAMGERLRISGRRPSHELGLS